MQLLCKTIRIYMTKKKLITEAIATPSQVQYFFFYPKAIFCMEAQRKYLLFAAV